MGRDPQPSAGIVGFPVGEDYLGGRRGSRIRRRQEGKGKKTSHLLVDTEGLVLRAKVHAANAIDREGIEPLLEGARKLFPRLSHLWLDAGYRGKDKGRGWVEKVLGWSVDLVERPRKPAPEEVLKSWAAEWAKEGEEVDWQKLMPPRGFQVLPRRWVVQRTFSWIDQNRRMSKDYERLTESSEAFIYVAMSRLMARRLACS
jgi:transposase